MFFLFYIVLVLQIRLLINSFCVETTRHIGQGWATSSLGAAGGPKGVGRNLKKIFQNFSYWFLAYWSTIYLLRIEKHLLLSVKFIKAGSTFFSIFFQSLKNFSLRTHAGHNWLKTTLKISCWSKWLISRVAHQWFREKDLSTYRISYWFFYFNIEYRIDIVSNRKSFYQNIDILISLCLTEHI